MPTPPHYDESYVDAASGLRLVLVHPALQPTLFARYLAGLHDAYQRIGAERALPGPDADVALAVLAFRDDELVGGVRYDGPFRSIDEVPFLTDCPDWDPALVDQVASLLDTRVIELKGLWASERSGSPVARALVRSVHVATALLEATWCYAATDRRLARVYVPSCGGEILDVAPVAWPDARYATQAVRFARRDDYPGSVGRLAPDPALEDVVWLDPRLPVTAFAEGVSISEAPSALAYLPWRRVVLALPDPAALRALRLERNRHLMNEAEIDRASRLRVGVVGLSAGFHVACTLALEGLVGALVLADFDDIEVGNLNRLPAGLADVGLSKARFAYRRIKETDPYLEVRLVEEGVTTDNLAAVLDGLDLLVEECDSLDVKVLVRLAARERGVPVIMTTSDREVLDVERFDLEPDRSLFHGLLGDVDPRDLAGLALADRAPYVLGILEADQLSARVGASLLEVDHSLSGWPQLAEEVIVGGALVAAALRHLIAGTLASGRIRLDLDDALARLATPTLSPAPPAIPAPGPHDVLDDTGLAPELAALDVELEMARAAALAPSGGNVQPWRLGAGPGCVEIRLAVAHPSAMDIHQRGSLVALGAALFNARVAAAASGRDCAYDVVGLPELARLRLLDETADPALAALAPALAVRHTNRRRPVAHVLDESERTDLRDAAPGALRLFEGDVRDEIAGLLGESDRFRFLTPSIHAQLFTELRVPGRDDLHVGLDVRTLEFSPASRAALGLLSRADVMGELAEIGEAAGAGLARNTADLVRASSALAVVSLRDVSRVGYVEAGQVLERLWLTAASRGLWLSPVAPVYLYATSRADLEWIGDGDLDGLEAQRQRFRELVGLDDDEQTVMVARLFAGPAPTCLSLRRPLREQLAYLSD